MYRPMSTTYKSPLTVFRPDDVLNSGDNAADLSPYRNAPAGLGVGPWLFSVAVAFDIPVTLWPDIATGLFDRFASLLVSIASHTNVHVFNSAQTIITIQPALPGTSKTSGDWVNEIHLTWQGYEKVAEGWVAGMGTVLV